MSLDESVPDARADNLWPKTTSGNDLTGSGVVFGIVDSGIDWTHADFISDDSSTRILYIWDQTLTPEGNEHHPEDPVNPGQDLFTYGVEYDSTDIQAELDDGPPYHDLPDPVRHKDMYGHGTHVTGIAAGDGTASSGSYVGVAPDVEIIVVGNSMGVADESGFDLWESQVIDGLGYLQTKSMAEGKPIVINLSLGSHFRSHDGNDPLSLCIEQLSG